MQRDAIVTAALVAASAVAIGAVRAPAADAERLVKETSDVHVLPPPEQVVRLSMGYRAALADLLWAHVLVTQGLRHGEKRRFDNLTLLLDSINELDPTFRDPYLFADALITFQSSETPREEVIKAREIMERGARHRPLDGEIWLVLGQFVAFIAPAAYIKDEDEKKQWRLDGARYLARAAELGGGDANMSWQALGGASILGRAGEHDAQIRFLERTLAVTDDDELKQNIRDQIDGLERKRAEEVKTQRAEEVEAQRASYARREQRFNEIWRRDLPFANKTTMLLIGPPRDPAYCAGSEHALQPRCAITWSGWAQRVSGGL